MRRTVLFAAAVVVGLTLQARPGGAAEGAWCAVYPVGGGGVRQDCQWQSAQECQTHIIAGDRGFCNANPRYTGPAPKEKKKK